MDINDILLLADETEDLIIGKGVIKKTPEIIKKYWPHSTALIIADTNTWAAAGETVHSLLREYNHSQAEPLIFKVPPLLHADYKYTDQIVAELNKYRKPGMPAPLPIAAGSGTINDLVKRAAFEAECSYLCVGTAASMDGYCSSGAALSKNGRKQTMSCPAPLAVIADTAILATAPPEASAAGFGDLASKLTAGADWLLADFTGDDPIEEQAWNIVQPNLQRWLSNPNDLSAVFEGLNYSGLAMQVLGRSRAASGAEHLLSHIWEMSGHTYADGTPVSHGFQVSIGILCVSALYEEVFAFDPASINIKSALAAYPDWTDREAEIEALMSALPSWKEYLDICRIKHLDKDALERKLKNILINWDELKHRIAGKLPSYSDLKNMLAAAGCPVTPAEIDLSIEEAVSAMPKAQCMRNRYTILDLAYELGIFWKCRERILDSGKYLI